MKEEVGDRAAFLLVYVREAHAADEWDMRQNPQARRRLVQPQTEAGRCAAAETMCRKLEVSIPTVVDGMDDAVMTAYGAWPDRIYVIGADGRIAYQSGVGPFGFRPSEVREFLRSRYDL